MINPLQFARTIQQAIIYRSAGMSQIEAVTQACRTIGISPEWAIIVQLVLDSRSALAEDWAERIYSESLDRPPYEGAFK